MNKNISSYDVYYKLLYIKDLNTILLYYLKISEIKIKFDNKRKWECACLVNPLIDMYVLYKLHIYIYIGTLVL